MNFAKSAAVIVFGLMLAVQLQAQELTTEEQAALVVLQAQIEAAGDNAETKKAILADAVQKFPNIAQSNVVTQIAQQNGVSISTNRRGQPVVIETITYIARYGTRVGSTQSYESRVFGRNRFSSSTVDPDVAVELLAGLVSGLSSADAAKLIEQTATLIASTGGNQANTVAQGVVNALRDNGTDTTALIKELNSGDTVMIASKSGTTSRASLL